LLLRSTEIPPHRPNDLLPPRTAPNLGSPILASPLFPPTLGQNAGLRRNT